MLHDRRMKSRDGIEPNLSKGSAAEDLIAFLDDVGATPEAITQTIQLRALATPSARAFADWLQPQTDGEPWSFLTMRCDGGGIQALAMPTRSIGAETMVLFPFVELHTLCAVWWLTTAWRTRQLHEAAEALTRQAQTIAAAACVRGLLETAAQAWVDSRKLADAWCDIKQAGSPATDQDAAQRFEGMRQVLAEVLLGSKFDEKAPGLQETYGRVKRSNVLTSIEKLTKRVGQQLQDDYQWLCNTVHPSLGNYYAFSSPSFVHDTGTHMITAFSGWPMSVENRGRHHAVRHVHEAVARSHEQSALILRQVLDTALRMIDDLGLTTRAPEISPTRYWRDLTLIDAQQPCPCRSGHRGYRCRHAWGDPAPQIAMDFQQVP